MAQEDSMDSEPPAPGTEEPPQKRLRSLGKYCNFLLA